MALLLSFCLLAVSCSHTCYLFEHPHQMFLSAHHEINNRKKQIEFN